MPIEPTDWYDARPDLTSYYQGDIIRDVPFIFLPSETRKWFLLRHERNAEDILRGDFPRWFEAFPDDGTLLDAWKGPNRSEMVAAQAFLFNVMILTQTCDLVRREYFQIAPVYADEGHDAIDRLRRNGLFYAFPLPAMVPHLIANSFVDLPQTCAVPRSYFPEESVNQRLSARLSEWARTKLQEKITKYFGRPFGFDESDNAKETGDYFCSSCFYLNGASEKKTFEGGRPFTECEKCKQTRWIKPVR
jgi:hypothetical protein